MSGKFLTCKNKILWRDVCYVHGVLGAFERALSWINSLSNKPVKLQAARDLVIYG
jgi:hypothetical protein